MKRRHTTIILSILAIVGIVLGIYIFNKPLPHIGFVFVWGFGCMCIGVILGLNIESIN